MSPKACTILVTTLSVLTAAILAVGFGKSLEIRFERERHYKWVADEITRHPDREQVLRDDLLESLYFGEKAASCYIITMIVAFPSLIFSFLVCLTQQGNKSTRVISWAVWLMAAMFYVFFAMHNVVI